MSEDTLICSHCGSECPDDSISLNDKYFCCNGCKMVYEILHDNNMDDFYGIDEGKGPVKPQNFDKKEFSFLDNPEIQNKLKTYSINERAKATFVLPQIHCSACIWLLENLPELKDGIIESRVDFLNKEVDVTFSEQDISLREVVELLSAIGYKPKLDLASLDKKQTTNPNRSLYLKLGIAGFCFGNLMLLAFPEYLSGGDFEIEIKEFISWINFIFIFPLLFAGSDYLKSAYYGIKTKVFNIDIPISIGLLALVGRSGYEIVSYTGAGYVDSLAGLIFFLLIGKLFQQKTYNMLSFSRDYKSYFPLSVIRKNDVDEEYISLKEIEIGDILLIRNNEIIPSDSILDSDTAMINYGFVTGESEPVEIKKNEKIYAGGRLTGSSVKVRVTKEFNQSYLTKLWNDDAFDKAKEEKISRISSTVAKYFSYAVITIAVATFLIWLPTSTSKAFDAFTAILIVACPCALALTLPFTYGTTMRVFGRNNFFIRKDTIVETMSNIKRLVFDKTGTLTKISDGEIEYVGKDFSQNADLVYTAVNSSTHPISAMVASMLKDKKELNLNEFEEISGKGVIAVYNGSKVRLGSSNWIGDGGNTINAENSAVLEIDGEFYGYFVNNSKFRNGIFNILKNLISDGYDISIISGDTEKDQTTIEKELGEIEMKFRQLPHEKLKYIESLQKQDNETAMIGDGLNDAGALAKADLGIAVAEKSTSFTPGSDAIILGEDLSRLPDFLEMSKTAIKIAYVSFGISFLYNIVGLTLAAQALLSPVAAAILMPISSITVIAFTVSSVSLKAKRKKL